MMRSTELSFDVSLKRHQFSLDLAHTVRFNGITALYGQNGSGKSTLLRILAGLEPAARGTITFGDDTWQAGAPSTMVAAHKRGVGFVFQEP